MHFARARTLLFALAAIGGLVAPACSCSDEPELCMTDEDCRQGELCSADGSCIFGAECVKEEDCVAEDPRTTCNLETFVCDFREGFGDECDETRPCPFGSFCSELLGLCLDSASSRDCVRRAQCPTGQICDRKASKCIPDTGCYGDDFCEDGELCDLVNRECRTFSVECISCILTNACEGGAGCLADSKECVAAGTEASCGEGEICDPLGRCVQCTNSESCGPGLFCNIAIGRCESNVQCADDPSLCPESPEVQCVACEAPEVCDARTKRCQAPPTICESDLDCPNDQLCEVSLDPKICVPRIPDCLNDLLDEPRNDSAASARQLEASAGPDFEELKVCPGDVDWYEMQIEAGTYLTIDARFSHEEGDLELQLYLADGRTLLDESRTTTDNERVELEVGTELTVLLRVFLARPTIRDVPYRLVVARDPGALCADDNNEPDDNVGDAKQLTSDDAYEARLCAGDPDWYALRNIVPGTRATVRLEFVDNLGDLDLEIYRAGATTPFLVGNTTTDGEELTFDASYGGDYFARVVAKGGDTNVYTIRAELREGEALPCLDDQYEANNTPTTATATAAGVIGQPQIVSLCAGDEDWYLVTLAPGESVQVDIGFEPTADLDVALYAGNTVDPNVAPIVQSAGTQRREFLGHRPLTGGDFLIRVYGHTQAEISPYEIDLRIINNVVCEPDAVDVMMRGDTQMDSFTLQFPPFREADLTLCTGDDDWFRVFLPGGFSNNLRLQYVGGLNVLDFELYDLGGAQLFTTLGQPFPNHREALINIPGQGIGVADVHIVQTAGANTPYTLALDLTPVFPCIDDVAEPNDGPAALSQIVSSSTAPSVVEDLTLCASIRNQLTGFGDEDWFVLNPPAEGARINASIEFEQGDLLLELFSPAAAARACLNFGDDRCFSDGFGLTEMVTFTATTTAPYILRVSSIYSSPNVPIRPPDIDTPYTLRVEYEE